MNSFRLFGIAGEFVKDVVSDVKVSWENRLQTKRDILILMTERPLILFSLGLLIFILGILVGLRLFFPMYLTYKLSGECTDVTKLLEPQFTNIECHEEN